MEPSWQVFGPEPARSGPEPGRISYSASAEWDPLFLLLFLFFLNGLFRRFGCFKLVNRLRDYLLC